MPPQSTCSIRTCDLPSRVRQLCNTHYNAALRTGQLQKLDRRAAPSITVACTTCGSPVNRRPWQIQTGQSVYCKRSCQPSPTTGRRAGQSRICKVCAKAFYTYPSRQTNPGSTNEFCSMACYNVARTGVPTGRTHSPEVIEKIRRAPRLKGTLHPRWKPRTTKRCEHCDTDYELSVSRPFKERGRQRFCSTKCWYDWMRSAPENSPTYNGGHEPFMGPNWREQARRARARDNYTCQDCGLVRTRPALDVHHIIPRRTFNRDWERANALPNLITLCKSCHKKREPGKGHH